MTHNTRCQDNRGGWKVRWGTMAQMGQYWLDNIFNDLPQEFLALDPSHMNLDFRSVTITRPLSKDIRQEPRSFHFC